jgi:hypothetical protein
MCGGGYAPPKAVGLFWGYALVWFSPADLLAQRRIKGVAQNVGGPFTAGQSHRLTSGGKAVLNMAYDFCAKLFALRRKEIADLFCSNRRRLVGCID